MLPKRSVNRPSGGEPFISASVLSQQPRTSTALLQISNRTACLLLLLLRFIWSPCQFHKRRLNLVFDRGLLFRWKFPCSSLTRIQTSWGLVLCIGGTQLTVQVLVLQVEQDGRYKPVIEARTLSGRCQICLIPLFPFFFRLL